MALVAASRLASGSAGAALGRAVGTQAASFTSASFREKVYVVGVGMTPFTKPGSSGDDYPDLCHKAGEKALADAGVPFDAVEQAVVGYVYGESTSGNRGLYELGMRGIPIFNTNNNCSTGSTALNMAAQFVGGGMSDCVLAIGFEKMAKGSLPIGEEERESPLARHMKAMGKLRGFAKAPPAPWLFGAAGEWHTEKYGTDPLVYAMIAQKNHAHSVHNPYAQFQKEFTLDEVLEAKQIYGPLTMLCCSPTSDGGAAAVIASEKFVKEYGLEDQAVEIVAQAMTTDDETSFDDPGRVVGSEMTRRAASAVYEASGMTVNDVDVVTLHDCFATNELITYEGLGLAEEGKGGKLVEDGDVTYGGKWVVNPAGGLISKGHPLGATGLAQCAEMCWHLRGIDGEAGKLVENATVGLQHNLGLGGAAVVTMYKRD